MSSSANPVKNTKASIEIMNDRIEQAIDAKRQQTRDVLKEVERNFQMSIRGHIDYHKYLMEEAKKNENVALMIHHRVLMETYESILKNYSMSNSYDRA